MIRETLKEWTEILVPWIQVVALISGGIFALCEYKERQRELRVEKSMGYIERLMSADVIEARLKFRRRISEKSESIREIITDKNKSQDQINAEYFGFVISEIIMPGTDQSLEAPLSIILGVLEEGAVCGEEGLCDVSSIRPFGRSFVQDITPYLCLRNYGIHEPFGEHVEMFYNKSAAATACEEYAVSLEKSLEKSPKGSKGNLPR